MIVTVSAPNEVDIQFASGSTVTVSVSFATTGNPVEGFVDVYGNGTAVLDSLNNGSGSSAAQIRQYSGNTTQILRLLGSFQASNAGKQPAVLSYLMIGGQSGNGPNLNTTAAFSSNANPNMLPPSTGAVQATITVTEMAAKISAENSD